MLLCMDDFYGDFLACVPIPPPLRKNREESGGGVGGGGGLHTGLWLPCHFSQLSAAQKMSFSSESWQTPTFLNIFTALRNSLLRME